MSGLTENSRQELEKRFSVILVRPENPENIGLVARNMKNTGFANLRIVGKNSPGQRAYVAAVHSREILDKARLYPDLARATSDLDLVFASTSKRRKNFSLMSLKNAVSEMFRFPPSTKIGLLFGNERTGLTGDELRSSNFLFAIPQVRRQPSYNLASAVLLTLFHISAHGGQNELEASREKPLSRSEQQELVSLILSNLEKRNFIHEANKRHVTEMVCDLFGRFALTERDRTLLLALFSKGLTELNSKQFSSEQKGEKS